MKRAVMWTLTACRLLLKMEAWPFACILLWMIAPTSINSWAESWWCKAEGESEDGYNPSYCFANKSASNVNIDEAKNGRCCNVLFVKQNTNMNKIRHRESPRVVTEKGMRPPVPDEIKQFVSVGEDGWVSFNYKEFASSIFDTFFIPLAVPLYTTRWNRERERIDPINGFEFHVLWNCSQSVTKTHKTEGFPLLTISYARFSKSFPPPEGHDTEKCDLCVNTIYIEATETLMFNDCSETTWRVPFIVLPENEYTKVSYHLSKENKQYSTSATGSICPLKLHHWFPDFTFVTEHNGTDEHVPYAYLPLRIHKPGKIHIWDEKQIPEDQKKMIPIDRVGVEEEFPFTDFVIQFPPENKLLV